MKRVFRCRLLVVRLSCSSDDCFASLVVFPYHWGCCVYAGDLDLAFLVLVGNEDYEVGEA